jgi:DNA polymerase V
MVKKMNFQNNNKLTLTNLNQCFTCAVILYSCKVSAGFPSPADDYIDKNINLNEVLIPRPSSTFIVRAQGDSMQGLGIFNNDFLIVDRSLKPQSGNVVIAAVNGDMTVKQLIQKKGKCFLKPANKHYPIIEISEGLEIIVWGVVTNVIHPL